MSRCDNLIPGAFGYTCHGAVIATSVQLHLSCTSYMNWHDALVLHITDEIAAEKTSAGNLLQTQ